MEEQRNPGRTAGGKKRTSCACTACRSRKSKCELAASQDPPCRRCVQEGRECILATSKRGGRRIRRPRPPQTDAVASPAQTNVERPPGDHALAASPGVQIESEALHASRDDLWHSSPSPGPSDIIRERVLPSQGAAGDIERDITSADLLNPSDALELLARVADRDREGGHHLSAGATDETGGGENGARHDMANPNLSLAYPPLAQGALSLSDVTRLVDRYREHYHPYYPIARRDVFDVQQAATWLGQEPYLMTAILTVASKDEQPSDVHEACISHMEGLIYKLVFRGTSEIGAIEALLILAEWFPQRLQGAPTAGRGEEDQGTWMQVGLAVRLGYLQGLEQAGLANKAIDSDDFHRKRLVWAACYMSDRQISIRLGKGFWSRGPGPGLALHSADFPSLRAQPIGSDDLGLLFQAHLELTQLFSNAYDILYASPSHREHLVSGGEYVRYIDDFSSALRRWKLTWGSLGFTPPVRAALTLSYDFLRLYINAFAFQANINRAIARVRQPSPSTLAALFGDISTSPDARFIYESIDAANSLLGTLNGFVDATSAFKCMPLKYYLYTMHAAVFLFKAKLAGAIRSEAQDGLRRTINSTIQKLQQSSANSYGIGHRYSRSLYMLWRKSPEKQGRRRDADGQSARLAVPSHGASTYQARMGALEMGVDLDHLNSFSWRDLDGLGDFLGTDMSVVESMLQSPGYESEHVAGPGQDTHAAGWYDPSFSQNQIIF